MTSQSYKVSETDSQDDPLTDSYAQDKQNQKQASVRVSTRSKKSASAFRTISEVARELDVQQHVLRFWETKFSQVKPLKRGGGRRYYRPEDVQLLKSIHHLLYTEGYTIKGVQKLLKEHGKARLVELLHTEPEVKVEPQNSNEVSKVTALSPQEAKLSPQHRSVLETMLDELKELRALVKPVS